MVEGGSSPGFAAEAQPRLRILRQVFGEKLQSNVAAQAEVLGLMEHTHPATALLREDFVMGNCASNHSGPLFRVGLSCCTWQKWIRRKIAELRQPTRPDMCV
jgi:hypothetical protein